MAIVRCDYFSLAKTDYAQGIDSTIVRVLNAPMNEDNDLYIGDDGTDPYECGCCPMCGEPPAFQFDGKSNYLCLAECHKERGK